MNANEWRAHLHALLTSGKRVTVEVSSLMIVEAASANGHFEGTTHRFQVHAESHDSETFATADEAITRFLNLLKPEE